MKMKAMKRFSSIVLALVMMLAMAMNVSAEPEGNPGKITVTNTVNGAEYKIYKLFDQVEENEVTRYIVKGEWLTFVNNSSEYVEVKNENENNYVTWKTDKWVDTAVAEFAKLALAYAENENIAPIGTKDGNGGTIEFDDLELGYYLVDSSVGAICALSSADPEGEVNEKNETPKLDKEVQVEPEGDNWGDANDVKIGDTVNFRVTITAQPGNGQYIMHDKMEKGLTFNEESVTVTLNGTTVDSTKYALVKSITDECTFEVKFEDEFCKSLNANDVIVVSYSAVLNEEAEIGEVGNKNESHLQYGQNGEFTTVPSETKTYTYEFDLVKTDNEDTVLEGARFRLYDAETEGNEIKLVNVTNGVYRVAKADEQGVDIVAGHVTIQGLEMKIYWLEEIEAPKGGYQVPDNRQSVEIKAAEGKEHVAASLKATVTNGKWMSGGIRVINFKGSELPSTGGIGTTIFYVVGGILVAGAVVLLVVKKRMSHQS